MKKLLALLGTALTLTALTVVPAAATPAVHPPLPVYQGMPQCVTTIWAAKHYGVPKTRPGAVCLLPMHVVPNTPGTRAYGDTVITMYEPAWCPASWKMLGIMYDDRGVTGLIMERPRVRR